MPGSPPVPPNSLDTQSLSPAAVLSRLMGLCLKEKWDCFRIFVCQILSLGLGIVGLGLTGFGIDFLRSFTRPDAPPVHWPLGLHVPAAWSPMQVLWFLAVLIMISAVLRGLFSWAGGLLLAQLVHFKLVAGLQRGVFSKLQYMSFRFFDQQSRGAIINRATGDIQAIRTFVDTSLIQAVITVLSLVVYASYMAAINIKLTLACLATSPVMWVACIAFSRRIHPEYLRNRELFDQMIRTLAESVEGVGVIKGFSREKESAEKFQEENRSVRDQQRRIIKLVSYFTPSIDFLSQINLIVLLVYGGSLVIYGQLPLGVGLVVFAGLLQQFSNQVGQIAQIANGVQESLASAGRVFTLLDAPLGLNPPPAPARVLDGEGKIRFEEVSFGYTDGRHVLSGISFEVSPGECVAIVGETGSGKTALLNLIPRFYDTDTGRVLIDDCDVRCINLQSLRRHVGVVFQESFLFSDTVFANIAFGDPGAAPENVFAAAKIAKAHDFIEALPEGYATILGESGVDLSGGQRQRLSIARALLTDPTVLLLDDPTAAIDSETEHEIMEAIEESMVGRTTLIVAHRLSTLKRADRILVLERGRIVQTGTHAELVRLEGPYRRAALHQMIDEKSRLLLAQEITDCGGSEREKQALEGIAP